MKEIRIHGRGGQGSVTASHLLSKAAFYDNKYGQGFPTFGVERRGAPVVSFVRIAPGFIRIRQQIYNPDLILIQDQTLIKTVPVFKGAKKSTKVIINSYKEPKEFNDSTDLKVVTFPATKFTLERIGKPIVNTVMLGVLAAYSDLITLESLLRSIKDHFGDSVLQKSNMDLASQAYQTFKKEYL